MKLLITWSLVLMALVLNVTACGHQPQDTATTHWVDDSTEYVCTSSGMTLSNTADGCICSYSDNSYQEACMVSHPKN